MIDVPNNLFCRTKGGMATHNGISQDQLLHNRAAVKPLSANYVPANSSFVNQLKK